MNKKNILISVIVVVKNGESTIRQCLDSLFDQDQLAEEYEVIVVDGGSTDKTFSLVQKYPVRFVKDEGGSIAHSRNVGVQAAQGEFIAFTDSDCVVKRNWLHSLYEEIQSRNDVIAVGGPNLVSDSDLPFSKVIGHMQETYLGSGGSPQSYAMNEPRYVYSIPNCNAMYRKKVFLEESFDSELNVGEDCELNFRLRKRGYSFLYFPNAIVWHCRPQNLKKFCSKMFSYGSAMAKIIKKHKGIVRWFAPVPAIVLFAIILNFILASMFPILVYANWAFFSLYSVFLLISTMKVYFKYRHKTSLLVFLLLPVQHFVYALGFLKGILWR
jgi:cellulose synthase/poly-beta-1,6-N-acetylglucosamine synthase-like glycosyltransferase